MIDNISSRVLLMCNVTNNCNQSCVHCVTNARCGAIYNLKYEILDKLIDSLQCLNLDYMMTLVGGEVTVWPDFYQLLHSEKFKNIKYKMLYTNATNLNDEIIELIKEARFYEVRVSIDSDRKEEHDDLRGHGTFDQTIKNVKLMLDSGIPITSATVIKNNNVNRIDNMVAYLKALGIKIMHLIPLYFTGRGVAAKQYELNEDEKELFIKHLQINHSEILQKRHSKCVNGTAYFKIDCKGDCYIQKGRDKLLLGNLYNCDFIDLYNSSFEIRALPVIECQSCPCYKSPILCENMYSYCVADLQLCE